MGQGITGLMRAGSVRASRRLTQGEAGHGNLSPSGVRQ